MELTIILLLLVLIGLVGATFMRRRSTPDRVEAMLGRSFIQFQQNIQQSLQTTRQEVEQSKDVLTDSSIKTLQTLNAMGKSIENLVRQQEEAQELGESLKNLLNPPKLRGSYGEAVLEDLLERALPKGIWERQYSIGGQNRVDAAVIVRDIVIPIDAKFPRDDYERYLAAKDAGEKQALWRNFEDAIKRQIRSIAEKYIKPELGTSDFALMFIPSDAVYYETVADTNHAGEPSSLPDFAQAHHVTMVSPSTFYAFLQMVIQGIRSVTILENARSLQKGLAKLERNFELFHRKFEEVGKGVEKAAEAYRVGAGHIERFRSELEATIALELPETPAPRLKEGQG